MVSNNLQPPLGIDIFIHNLLHSISWSILHPILSVRVPSIQAFAESVFLYTIASQQVHIVKDLSSHAHIKATVVSNGSALVSAVRTSSCELVSMILDAGACPNKRSECGEQPLTVVEDVSVAKLLLQAGADIHSEGVFRTKTRKFHGPGVMAAIASRNIDLVRYLITEGADVNQLGRHAHLSVKFSAVMLAVESGMSKILELLLQSGAKPNETSVTTGNKLREMYPLQEAARRGDVEAVQLLIEHGGNVNANVKWLLHVDSALETAVSHADVMMTKLLLRTGADVNAPPNNDVQPPRGVLTIAVEMNHFELVEVVLDAGADVSILSRGYYGCTARECAICSPHGSDIRDLLVSRGAQWDTQCQTDHCQTQLREAVLAADLSRVKTLLSTGLKIDMQPFEDDQHRNIYDQDDRTKSVLQDAVAAGSAIFQMVFDVIEDYDEEIDLHPLLVEAISVKAFDIGAILLNAGADVNATRSYAGERMGTPLMFAIQGNDFEAVQFLYDKGADINIVVDPFAPLSCQHYYHACTALQVSLEAANRGTCSLDIYHFLRQPGAVINAPIPRMWGLSELALAAETGKIAIVQGLLDAGADVNSLPAESRGRTALQAAAGDIDIVQLLLQSGANVNGPIARERGVTALGAAASAGHFQVALILLKAGADVNAEFEGPGSRDNPLTPLIDAARYGRLDMVHLLLKAGADLHLPEDERYVKAARVARERGQVAIATFLETWKVDEALESSIGTRMAQNGEEGFVIELD
jgi:ankyrin repeat protein